MYIEWSELDSSAIDVPRSHPSGTGIWYRCTMPPVQTSTTQTLVWELHQDGEETYAVGVWVGSDDPLDAPASIEDIKEVHLKFETAPIEVSGILFDADDRSETRLRNSIAAFDLLPLIPNQVEVVDGVKLVYWKGADGISTPLTKEALTSGLDTLIILRGVRGAILFNKYQYLKRTLGTHTINQVRSYEYWESLQNS